MIEPEKSLQITERRLILGVLVVKTPGLRYFTRRMMARSLSLSLCHLLITANPPVEEVDNPVGMLRDIRFMRDQDDGVPLFVES